jgi:hypothetical protein
MRQFLAVLAVSLLGGACSNSIYAVSDISSVPANPTYNNDIWPLYNDHCLLCHSFPANRGAPNYFRLDVFGNDGSGVIGAQTMGSISVHDVQIQRMPPAAKDGGGVGPNGLEMLLNWQTNGFPE